MARARQLVSWPRGRGPTAPAAARGALHALLVWCATVSPYACGFGLPAATVDVCASAPCHHGGTCTPTDSTGGAGGGSTVEPTTLRCVDKKRNGLAFSDAWGTCAVYAQRHWCTAQGRVGSGWQASWGQLSGSAKQNCCACGGGRRITAAPAGGHRRRKARQHGQSYTCHCKPQFTGSSCTRPCRVPAGCVARSPHSRRRRSARRRHSRARARRAQLPCRGCRTCA